MLLSDRPHDQARALAHARGEVLRSSGREFDPGIVEVFLDVPNADWERMRA